MATVIGCDNRVLTSSLTATSAAPSLPVANLQLPHGDSAHAYQSVPGATTITISLDAGSADATWQLFSFHRSNLTSDALCRWAVGSQEWIDGTSPPAYDSGLILAGVAAGYGQSVHLAPAVVSGRYCRLSVMNTTNPDGFVAIALAYAGPLRSFKGISPQSTWQVDSTQDETVTRGGQQYLTPRFERRSWDVQFPSTPNAQAYADVAEVMRVSRLGQNILFVPFSTSADRNREAVFGTFTPSRGVGFTNSSGLSRT